MFRGRTAAIALALAWTAGGPLAVATALAGEQGGQRVPYLSGGLGSDARKQLESEAKGYNLLVEIADPSGAFQGGGRVAIRDASGTMVLDAQAEGPQLYAKLPPGRYTVAVDDDGARSKADTVEVPASGRATVVLDVRKP